MYDSLQYGMGTGEGEEVKGSSVGEREVLIPIYSVSGAVTVGEARQTPPNVDCVSHIFGRKYITEKPLPPRDSLLWSG